MKQKFYITIDGKQKNYNFPKDEYEQYKNVCESIWGGLPYDLSWAWNTNIYKEALEKYKRENK